MAKIHREFDQLSPAWMQAHVGRPTASEFDNLLTPEFKARTGETPRTYLAKKVAEAWRGMPLPGLSVSSWAMEQGLEWEQEARAWAAIELDVEMINVGFVEHDDGRCGCSPDALIGEEGGIEIKAPNLDTHVKYLLAGTLPKDYAAQVHGSLYVTGRRWWKFLSYRRGFPPLLLTIERDEAIMARIGEALAGFYAEFDAAMERLRQLENAR